MVLSTRAAGRELVRRGSTVVEGHRRVEGVAQARRAPSTRKDRAGRDHLARLEKMATPSSRSDAVGSRSGARRTRSADGGRAHLRTLGEQHGEANGEGSSSRRRSTHSSRGPGSAEDVVSHALVPPVQARSSRQEPTAVAKVRQLPPSSLPRTVPAQAAAAATAASAAAAWTHDQRRRRGGRQNGSDGMWPQQRSRGTHCAPRRSSTSQGSTPSLDDRTWQCPGGAREIEEQEPGDS